MCSIRLRLLLLYVRCWIKYFLYLYLLTYEQFIYFFRTLNLFSCFLFVIGSATSLFCIRCSNFFDWNEFFENCEKLKKKNNNHGKRPVFWTGAFNPEYKHNNNGWRNGRKLRITVCIARGVLIKSWTSNDQIDRHTEILVSQGGCSLVVLLLRDTFILLDKLNDNVSILLACQSPAKTLRVRQDFFWKSYPNHESMTGLNRWAAMYDRP